MSNLDNLTAKIIADGEIKSKTITDNAAAEAKALVTAAETEAGEESKKLLAAAEDEAKKLVELALSAKRIETRDKILAAKQQTIDKALFEAKNRLSVMDSGAYVSFITSYLTKMDLSPGEKLRVPQAYASIDMDALNAKLAESGKPALTLDSDYTANGFKLIKGDIENDNSFDALIDYYRVSLEQTVVERLFV